MGKKRLKELIFFHGCFVTSVNSWLRVERTLCRQSGVGLVPHVTTRWCYSLTVKWGAFSVTATKNICPLKNSQKPHPWTLQTSERLCKKQTALSFVFCFHFVSAMLSRCQGSDATLRKLLLAKHECAHYVQIALAHSNSLTAECWGLSEDVRNEGERGKKIVPYSSTGCLGGQMAPGWKEPAVVDWLCLEDVLWGLSAIWPLRAFKPMVRVNPCLFIHTGSIREEMLTPLRMALRRCQQGIHWEILSSPHTEVLCLLSPLFAVMEKC